MAQGGPRGPRAYTVGVIPTAECPPRFEPFSARELAERIEHALAERVPTDIDTPGRRAGVLLLIHDLADRAHLLLTKRAAHLPSHPGQVSLPGGLREERDASLAETALRETWEEVGIAQHEVRVIGRLDDVDTIASGFLIRPFIAIARGPIAPAPAPDEVDRVIHAPVDQILSVDERLPGGMNIRTTRYPLDGEDVWGATARIIRTFCAVARCAAARRA